MYLLYNVLSVISLFVFSNAVFGKTIQIAFTEYDSYSIEVAHVDVGDTIEWLPITEGHNVEFLGGPNINTLPEKSKLNAFYAVTFDLPGVYFRLFFLAKIGCEVSRLASTSASGDPYFQVR